MAQLPDRKHALVIVLAAAFGVASCSGGSETGPPVLSSIEASTQTQETIRVQINLPGLGHMDVVDGVVLDQGVVIAEFRFQAGLVFAEEPAAENDWRPSTSLVEEANTAIVGLPGPGIYTFKIDEVGYWGGCGTCGHGMSGGSVEAKVVDGSLVELDLGEETWIS